MVKVGDDNSAKVKVFQLIYSGGSSNCSHAIMVHKEHKKQITDLMTFLSGRLLADVTTELRPKPDCK